MKFEAGWLAFENKKPYKIKYVLHVVNWNRLLYQSLLSSSSIMIVEFGSASSGLFVWFWVFETSKLKRKIREIKSSNLKLIIKFSLLRAGVSCLSKIFFYFDKNVSRAYGDFKNFILTRFLLQMNLVFRITTSHFIF